MNMYSFRTIIEAGEDGTYHAYAPALPGCRTWGWSSIDEARRMLREAIDLYIRSLVEDGEPIPSDIGLESIETVTLNMAHA